MAKSLLTGAADRDRSGAPRQFFIFSLLLYEILTIVFAIKAAVSEPRTEDGVAGIDWSYPAVWFLSWLVIFSFSSGRQPEHAVLVAFPLLLLGGMGWATRSRLCLLPVIFGGVSGC